MANAGKGGRSGGKPAGQKGKLGTIGENSQPDSVATVAEKKKLQELKKKSNAEAKHLKQLRRAKNQARPKTCNFCKTRDVRWPKFVGTGTERNAFPFKKDLSLSSFFSFFLFLKTGLSTLSNLSLD